MGIKLKKGDCVDVRGLSEGDKVRIVNLFIESGGYCSWTHKPREILSDDRVCYIFWSMVSNLVDGRCIENPPMYKTMYNGENLIAELRSQDDTSDDLTTEELLEKHAEIRKSAETVISVNRNVVFTDYQTNHLPGSMEITITDGEEVTVCVDKFTAFDNIASKKNIEETVDILKVWRSIIDSAIKEMEE